MTRRMRKQDWQERCKHLANARAYLATARADKSQRDQLDLAIWSAWTFGEFAVNVCLELRGEDAEIHHEQATRAADLFALDYLQRDYSKTLEQLREYRLRADYGPYSKGSASTHYSPKNVEDCLDDMDRLRDEVEALLREQGRL